MTSKSTRTLLQISPSADPTEHDYMAKFDHEGFLEGFWNLITRIFCCSFFLDTVPLVDVPE